MGGEGSGGGGGGAVIQATKYNPVVYSALEKGIGVRESSLP